MRDFFFFALPRGTKMSKHRASFDSLLMSFKSFLDLIFITQFQRIKFQENLRELSNGNRHNNHLF